ncbi:phage morphogenesis protein [Kaistia algarum]|uniref:phage virion morphogenesis protein n=1 Tax=Kaistia algarum TaxID=2083279 RepID=UPI000CE9285C|nr:phage virion morphogenesis protein [Kaistia algarum]MCX5512277.1 phage virion morphogenesis protein [Kaistia algarum]PPE80368.1 phage morphogenesis protein [Kaistia algarum]
MDGIGLVIDTGALEYATRLVSGLGDFERRDLLSSIGALGESQTRRRIVDEKTGPDGTPWPPNREGTPILVRSGQHLLASVSWIAGSDEVQWGAGWEYAHVHQDGMTIVPKTAQRLVFTSGGKKVHAKKVTIPPRPFVGLSSDNIAEIEELVSDVFGGAFDAPVPVAP